METMVGQKREDRTTTTGLGGGVDEYREAVRKLIATEVKNALDEEMRKAAQELVEEQRKAIRKIVEENKAAIQQVVEEEKKAIWTRAEALRKSISKLGL